MSLFLAAINEVFADPNLARDALWRAGGVDPPITVRVILRQPDRIAEFGETRFAAATMMFEMRVAEAPSVADGDTLEVDGVVYVIQGEPLRDASRLVWTAEACPA